MENPEFRAKTVDEAIQQALDQLGVSREEVEVEVVKEGKAGILGMGADDAVVRVTVREPGEEADIEQNAETGQDAETGNAMEADDATGIVRELVEQLLGLMDVEGTVTVERQPAPDEAGGSDSLMVNIGGEDLGILIGRRGQTLAGLQYIVRLVVGHRTRNWLPITIDVEGYKQRRHEGLQAFARQMAEQVKERDTPFSLEPMSAYERRLIHLELADHPDVVTESMGEGESRRVVILPRGTKL